ncbi:hypothetical protein LB503_010220 [Fusarium chuoi]|nr:hypothetical protein LB503_010220 [Fusarium chuoi]
MEVNYTAITDYYMIRPSSTSPKHEPTDTAHAPFLAHDSSDDVAYSQTQETIPHTRIRDNWHGGPKTLEHWDAPTVFGWIFSVLLTFTPLCFIALAITAIRLDNQPHSDYGKTVLQLTVLSPSLYPILFAALVGRFYRVFGRWCLESRGGVNLPVLEQLIGSQNLATAIERIFVIRTNAVIGIIILTSWLLSPLGGQSSSRLLQDAKFDLVSNGTVYYADPAYQVSHSRWIDYRHSVGATYAASLLSSSKQKASPRDIWGLPKIPQLSQERLDNGSYDLYDVNKSDLVSGKASYASLLGIKIRGLVRPNEPTKFNFTIPTSYFHVTCDFVDSFDPLRGKLTQNQTIIVNRFYNFPSFSTFNILPQSWFNADGQEDDINSPYLFMYVKQMRGSQLYVVQCATHEVKVETTIHCGPGDPATTCEARQQRRLSTENQTGSSLYPPSITRSDLRLKELSYALYAWAQASGDMDGVQPSPSEMYLMKDENPYEFTTQLPWTKEDLAKFPYVFSRRMTTAFNTYWDAGLNPGGHTNVSYGTIPLHNMNGLETGQTYKDSFMNTTMGTRITTIDVYSAQRIWVSLLLFTTMVLQILAICGLVIEILIQGPDVLGFASTLTRDNPFVPLPAGGSHLDGPERARCLKNMRLELVDVRPEDETGRDEDRKPHTYGQAAAATRKQAEGRPPGHGHFAFCRTDEGYIYEVPKENENWAKPLGKKLLILDVDTRLDKGPGAVMNDSALDYKEMKGRTGGIMNHYLYAMIHGYDYKFVRAPDYPKRHQTWVKVPMIREALKSHDFVVFLDADAEFMYPQVPFEWLMKLWNITDQTLLALANDPDSPRNRDEKGKVMQNTGFMIAQQSNRTQELFDDWEHCPGEKKYKGCARWANDWAHEQAAFSNYVRYSYNQSQDIGTIPCMDGNGAPYIGDKTCGGVFIRHHWFRKDDPAKDLQRLILEAFMRVDIRTRSTI